MPSVSRRPARSCALEAIVDVLGGKWKPGILFNLMTGPMRFAEMRRRLGPITEKMLAQQLRELVAEGVVQRIDHHEVPPHVEYALTPYGRTLQPILVQMGKWGEKHIARAQRAEATAD